MKEIVVGPNEAGQRLDKLLKKYLNEAPKSFLYKMLRKKNIVLNKKKAFGNEKLAAGDRITLFLSDDTVEKFSRNIRPVCDISAFPLDILYEDAHIILINKPAGVLSQKARAGDLSVIEAVTAYLLREGGLTEKELRTFRPSVCNRLDRNTSGLIVAGKSLLGLQTMAELLKTRAVAKYYLCFVKGKISEARSISGYLKKDGAENKVEIISKTDEREKITAIQQEGYVPIETEYVPMAYNQNMTLLKVHLITGRTHQIRAHLAVQGHPILGDYKYGEERWNWSFRKRYHIDAQLLHAYQLEFPKLNPPFSDLSGRTYRAKVPPVFWKLIEETTWEHGIQEALEVLH